jgi:hypothetical protein
MKSRLKINALHMKNSILSLVAYLSFSIIYHAQTTVTTTHTNNNGNGSVIFNVQNTNAFDIIVTGVQCHLGTTATNNVQLLYRTTPFVDLAAPWDFGVVGAGQNGWISAGTGVVSNTNTANGIVPALSGLFLIIPAGQTYQLGFSGTTIQYMTLTSGAGTNTFSAGGVNIITGDGISWGGVAYPATPGNYPRGFIGGITFIPGVACAGTPTAGTTAASANPVCPSVGTTLSLNGATMGTGLTYQWQSSADGVTYTNISGATASSYVATQTTDTYYQCVVTCSGSSSTSTPLLVTTSTFINCYCTSNATSTADEEILNVSIGTLNNSSTCSTTGGPGSIQSQYSNYTTTVPAPILAASAAYNLSVNIGTCGGNYGNMTKVFIDYNQNGLFTDPGETVYTSPAASTGPNIINASIIIPPTATVGLTRMRVVNVETTIATGINPCGTYTWGETEDYLVQIAPVPTCPQPTNFSLITADLTSAQLQWVAGGSETQWEIEYGPIGFAPGTGTSVLVTTNPYTLSGLTTNSFYSAYIRGICTPGDSSYFAGAVTFNTFGQGQYMESDNECGPGFFDISGTGTATNLPDDGEVGVTLPFNFLFQGVLMNNLTIADNGGIILGTTTGQLGFSNGAIATAPANSFVAFWDDVQSSTLGNIYYQTVGTAPNQQFIVQWEQQNYWPGTTPTESITYQIVLDQASNEVYYIYEDAVFGGATAAFDNGANATIGVNGPNQDIQLSLNSPAYLANNSCAHFYYTNCPKPTNYALSFVTPEEVAFSWSAGLAAETNWTIVYGPAGFDPATSGTTITTTTTSANILGLTQNTEYDFYIFADCSPTLQSNGLLVTILTPPWCANPTNMINNVASDSIFSSWNWTLYSPAYPVTGFNVTYGMPGYDPYSQGTEFNFDADFNDTLVDPALMGGGVYQVYVQAVCGADTSQYVGPFTVTMPLTNNDVCGAELLQVDGTVYTFNNTGGTVQANETTIAPPATGAQTNDGWINSTLNNTTWFTFIAPSSGNVRINNTGINYAGQAAVYESLGCSDFGLFTLISANDNAIGGTSVAPNFTACGLTPGDTVYLMIDGSTATTGNHSISITPIILEAGAYDGLLDVCTGDTINLFDGISGNDNGGLWTAEIAAAGTGIHQDSLFASAGLAYQVFDFEYRLTDGCAYDSIVTQVEIYAPSSAGGDGTLNVCRNQPVDLLAGLTGNVDFGGTWYDPSNNPLSNSEIISSNIPGQFNYDYITGNGVCPNDTANVLVTVDASCNYLSIEDEKLKGINIYPNPTNGILFIATEDNNVTLNITVTDMEGRVVMQSINETNASGIAELSLSDKVTGVYFVKVRSKDSEKVFKIILQ